MKKVGNSFRGIVGGIIAIIIGVILLWWNEGNNVKNIKTTDEMCKVVVDIDSSKIDSSKEGSLVATHGKLVNEETLQDKDFNVSIVTPKMVRIVEVYQWEEEKDEDTDGNTTHSYRKIWSDELIDSSSFVQSGHENPKSKPYEDKAVYSSNVTLGAFKLSTDQVEMLSTDGVFSEYDSETLTNLGFTKNGNYITNSSNYDNPNIGDVRIIINYNNSTDVSVLAVQTGNTFTDFVSSVGKKQNRVFDGVHTGSEMISDIVLENNFLKWMLRLVGTLLCISGIATIFKPISTLANFVPILGGLVDMAVGLIALITGLALSLVVIAIAWIRFRPLIGILLLVVVGVLVFLLIKMKKRTKAKVEVNNEEVGVAREVQPEVNNEIEQTETSEDNNQTM